jgi:hypothetical protein
MAVTAVIIIVPAQAKLPQPPSDLVVHEWGTFLAMQGSDGLALDGMYHEEHSLPPFVHSRSRDQLRLPGVFLKGETPVIYFYTTRPQEVSVSVEFPRGIWTQWYPQAQLVSPTLATPGLPPQLRNGRIAWSVELTPGGAGSSAARLPATAADSLWNFARDVDAASVRTLDRSRKPQKSEWERFIFYRGLGQATLPLEMTSRDGGALTARQDLTPDMRHLFIVRVDNGKGVYKYLPTLRPGETRTGVIPPMTDSLPLDQFTHKIADELAARLTECGLYAKEARAMVNTWRTSYFHSDGIRVLFVLPQRWTDELIPLEVSPRPKELIRVMVGRLEVLTPERERRAESSVRGLASSDADTREAAFASLRDQGRYVEPIVRRVLRTTQDAHVQTLCRRLLLTDFVTELRAAINSPTNGERLREEPLFVRARLASLLREIGLHAEAKAEAERVSPALRQLQAPPMTDHTARHYLRAYARMMEGLGDEQGAAEWYGKFVRFGSQVRGRRDQCINCHRGSEGPHDMAWFRDWWAGKRFARYALRAGRMDKLIAEHEAAVQSDPKESAAELMLAYLYEAKGDAAHAEKMWAKLGVRASTSESVVAKTGSKKRK